MRAQIGISCIATIVLGCGTGWADPPVIKYMVPSAIAPGRATEVSFVGSNLGAATNLWTSFPAKSENIRCAEDRAIFKISLPPNCANGLGAVRLVATNGISDLHLLMIDRLPSMEANGTNRSAASAQELKPAVALDGACAERAADFFKFAARKGQRLSFEVVAQRLGSALDPLVRLLDAGGHELVFCEDTPGAGVDCRFSHRFASSGQYLLELRDTRYDGGSQYRYRLRAGEFSLEPAPLPFHVKPEFGPPASLLPQITEVEPNDLHPQNISVPASIHGRFAQERDRDCFQFDVAKGQRLLFRSRTRSLGSPCDLYLRLESAAGKKLAESPLTGPDESSVTNTFKEAETCRLIIEEAAQLGGPEFFYQVEIAPFQPGFGLSVEPEKLQGAAGGTAEIKVLPERREYDGPITLSLEGAGHGFALESDVITSTSKTNASTVKIKLPADLEPGRLVNFKIIGHAKIDGQEFAATASTRPALRKLFPHLPWPPAELDGWIALGVTPAAPKKADAEKN